MAHDGWQGIIRDGQHRHRDQRRKDKGNRAEQHLPEQEALVFAQAGLVVLRGEEKPRKYE